MKLCHVPYRWTWGTVWNNVIFCLDDILCGFENIVHWIPVIWFDRNFDYSSTLIILEYKFRKMAERFEKDKVVSDWSSITRQLKICALLCNRLYADEYAENAALEYIHGTKAWADEMRNVERQDQEMLGKIIGKHLTSWWD